MSASSAILRSSQAGAGQVQSLVGDRAQLLRGGLPVPGEAELPLAFSPPLSVAGAPGPAPRSASGLEVSLHRDLMAVSAEWKAFEQDADRTPFQSFEWLAAWQLNIGARRGTLPAIVLGRDGDGTLLFLMPLAIERSHSLRRLTWLGSQLSDYNAPLLAQRFCACMSSERFRLAWQDVLSSIRHEPELGFDLVDLEKMPQSVGSQRNPFLNLGVDAHPSGAYVATLDRRDMRFVSVEAPEDAEGEFARFGPGRSHLNELIRHAIERGLARSDFTVGDEPYKRAWSDIELFDHLSAVTLRGAAAAAITRAFRRSKRSIKQSPRLWAAFSKLRVLTGRRAAP